MQITYAGEAYDSFYQAIDAMQGYTVRVDLADGKDRDVEIIGVSYPEEFDNEASLDFYPTDPEGNQYDLDNPNRVKQSMLVADITNIFVY